MQSVFRGLDFVTGLDGLCMIVPFIIGAKILSLGTNLILFIVGGPPVHLMGAAWTCAGIVSGAWLCRLGVEVVVGPLGTKSYTVHRVEHAVGAALLRAAAPSCEDTVRAAILYRYPIPDVCANTERTPEMQRLAEMLADENPGFTYHVVQEHADDTDDVVLFTVGTGRRKAAVVWTDALAATLDARN